MIDKDNLNELLKKNAISIIIFVFMVNYYFIHCFCLDGAFAAAALEDSGWLSIFNVLLILSAQAFAVWHFCRCNTWKERLGFFSLIYVFQIYALREADFHRLFTMKNVDNLKLYTSPEVPLVQKLVAGIIFFPFFAFFAYLIIFYGIYTVKEFFKGTPWAVSFAFWGSCITISQIMDKSKMNHGSWRVRGIEEMLEVTAGIYALLAMIHFTVSLRAKRKTQDLS
jgi:hypothetical protein